METRFKLSTCLDQAISNINRCFRFQTFFYPNVSPKTRVDKRLRTCIAQTIYVSKSKICTRYVSRKKVSLRGPLRKSLQNPSHFPSGQLHSLSPTNARRCKRIIMRVSGKSRKTSKIDIWLNVKNGVTTTYRTRRLACIWYESYNPYLSTTWLVLVRIFPMNDRYLRFQKLVSNFPYCFVLICALSESDCRGFWW